MRSIDVVMADSQESTVEFITGHPVIYASQSIIELTAAVSE